jgi:hypothetical protein
MVQNRGQAKFMKMATLVCMPILPTIVIYLQDELTTSKCIMIILFSALFMGFFYFKYHLLELVENKYVERLLAKDKAFALELGRRYYSMKRGGVFLGADGSRCTIYDEQAIANEINSYCD